MRFPIFSTFISLFRGAKPLLSKNVMPFLKNDSFNHFKINSFLDKIYIYDYYFEIDHEPENFLLYNDRFNEKVKTIKTLVYKLSEHTSEKKIIGKRTDEYNEEKLLIKRKDAATNSQKEYCYTYNQKKQLTEVYEKKVFDNNDEVKEKFIEIKYKKSVIKMYEKFEKEHLFKRLMTYYIKNGLVVRSEDNLQMFNAYNTTNSIVYKKNGYKIKNSIARSVYFRTLKHDASEREIEVRYEKDELEYTRILYKYNANNDITGVKVLSLEEDGIYFKEPKLAFEYVINYEYDAYGNWISMRYDRLNEDRKFLFLRTISYY
ncbi:hypothetical protein [Kordia sp.]|uniref:hypothetical protein n=1 Tax=Kordia sp. TaxID=1965332 RepID=UPI003D2D2B21